MRNCPRRKNSSTPSMLAAGLRRDAGCDERFLCCGTGAGQLGQRGAHGLAALRERGVDDRERTQALRLVAGWLAAGPRDQRRLDIGHRPEHVAADRPREPQLGVPSRLDARHPVRLGARPGGEAVCDFGLHHHEACRDRREPLEERQQDGHGHVVGQVCHQRRRGRPGQLGDLHRVGGDEVEVRGLVGGVLRDRGRQLRRQDLVELHRGDVRCHLEQPEGQRSQAGTDLDDNVIGADTGRTHDASHGVGVDDEILPALLGRADAAGLGQAADVSGSEQPAGLGRG